MPRPSSFTPEIAAAIFERLAGGESLRSICRDDQMPPRTTVFRWLQDDSDFAKDYAHARELQAESLVDEIMDIADDARNDWMARSGEDDAGWTLNGENIQRSKVRIAARQWMAMKLLPKKYGDKQQISVTATHEDWLAQLDELG